MSPPLVLPFIFRFGDVRVPSECAPPFLKALLRRTRAAEWAHSVPLSVFSAEWFGSMIDERGDIEKSNSRRVELSNRWTE